MIVWEMAEQFNWPLEYVESLPLSRLHEWEQIKDGRANGIAERRRRDAFLKSKEKDKRR
jgi:hypothetical protein